MGIAKRTRKYAQTKRVLRSNNGRNALQAAPKSKNVEPQHIPQLPSNLFFASNQALGPPYHVLLDTNFFSHTVNAKIDLLESLMDLLHAQVVPVVTNCVIAELEKLGEKYRIALRVAKDSRWQRLTCDHPGTYADDCIVERVTMHRIYLLGTDDKDLRRRLRKIPGVPLIGRSKGKFTIERLPRQ